MSASKFSHPARLHDYRRNKPRGKLRAQPGGTFENHYVIELAVQHYELIRGYIMNEFTLCNVLYVCYVLYVCNECIVCM